MEHIKVLIVDDEAENATLFEDEFRTEFRRLSIDAEFSRAKSANEALQTIGVAADSKEGIDVVLVDLCLTGGSNDPDGARVLKHIKEHHRDAYVLLYTGMPEQNPGFTHRYERETNRALTRWDIGERAYWSWRTLAEDMKSHLINVGRLDAGPVDYDQHDVGIMSVLDQVGQAAPAAERHKAGARILRLLALQCLDGLVSRDRDLRIEFLAPGRSGANVCRLIFSGGDRPPQSFVLKFGFDQGALRLEFERNAEAVSDLGHSTLMKIAGKPATHNSGYHAITTNYLGNASNKAVPLRKWLTDFADAEQARTMAEQVLVELLDPFFYPGGLKKKSVDEWMTLGSGRRLRTLAAIDRYGSVLGDERAYGLPDSVALTGLLSAFVKGDREVAGAPSEQATVTQVRSFGDLHSNNILVQLGAVPRPVLIDASLYDVDHWAADHARLLVDLLLRVRNAGVESFLWPPMTDADEQVVLLCNECQSPESLEAPGGAATDAFIAKAVQQLVSATHRGQLAVASTFWHWEWHVALARELLRQATYEDMTPPRACMGLVLAERHLRIARKLPK